MRLFEAWRLHGLHFRRPDTPDTRSAFNAGARHVLNELIDHLDDTDEATTAAHRLNDEIRDFGRVALLLEVRR